MTSFPVDPCTTVPELSRISVIRVHAVRLGGHTLDHAPRKTLKQEILQLRVFRACLMGVGANLLYRVSETLRIYDNNREKHACGSQ